MEKHFCNYNQALVLKEIGFNENCFGYYNSDKELKPVDTDFINFREVSEPSLKSPLKSQVFEWFRKYRLSVVIEDYLDDYEVKIVEWTLSDDRITHEFPNRFDSWGDAESEAIDKLIELVKNK